MTVNGNNVSLKDGMTTTLKMYLEDKGYDLLRIAVEKNGAIIPQNSFESETLCNDDTLEIVCFVGGG